MGQGADVTGEAEQGRREPICTKRAKCQPRNRGGEDDDGEYPCRGTLAAESGEAEEEEISEDAGGCAEGEQREVLPVRRQREPPRADAV